MKFFPNSESTSDKISLDKKFLISQFKTHTKNDATQLIFFVADEKFVACSHNQLIKLLTITNLFLLSFVVN